MKLVALLFAGASALAPSRRAFLSKVAGAATGAAVAAPAFADTDYAGLPYLGGSEKIDINNANVRVYAKLPGTLARPIRPQPISRVTNEARSFSS